MLQSHVKTSLFTILRELSLLLDSIPVNEHGVEQETGSRDTLANTGVLWEVCDQLIKVGDDGVGQMAVQRAKQDLGLFEDAIRELEEWEPGDIDEFLTNLSDADQSSDEENDRDTSAEKKMKAEALALFQELRLLASRLPDVLGSFPALNKKTNVNTGQDGPTTDQCNLLDAILEILHRLTEDTDELAGALYANDTMEVKQSMAKLKQTWEKCDHLKLGDLDQADQLSDWSRMIIMR